MPPSANDPSKETPEETDSHDPEDAAQEPDAPSPAKLPTRLFIVPMLFVVAMVAMYLLLRMVSSADRTVEEYAADLTRPGHATWQSAHHLARLLSDPSNEHLKRDASLAQTLVDVLQKQIEEGRADQGHLKLRMFLCRALGQFELTDNLPVLIVAAVTERTPNEADVRLSAIEAIAVLIDNVGADAVRDNERLMPALLDASREPSDQADDANRRDRLRATAAFALGVLGTQQARDRLHDLLSDPYIDARCNAANGLARHGDARAVDALLQTLDAAARSNLDLSDEPEGGREVKGNLITTNALRAVKQLAEKNDQADLTSLVPAVQAFRESVNPQIQLEAIETLRILDKRSK